MICTNKILYRLLIYSNKVTKNRVQILNFHCGNSVQRPSPNFQGKAASFHSVPWRLQHVHRKNACLILPVLYGDRYSLLAPCTVGRNQFVLNPLKFTLFTDRIWRNPAETRIIRDKNAKAWVSMVLYLKNWNAGGGGSGNHFSLIPAL